MTKTQFRSKNKKRISPKLFLVATVFAILALLMLNSVVGVAKKYFLLRRHIQSLNEERGDLERKYEVLVKNNKYLSTPEGEERLLREKYNVAKEGEGVIVIVNEEGDEMSELNGKKIPWWKDFFSIFKRKEGQ